jgi:hypothetical protein
MAFGELALINAAPRAASCKALSRTACATLTKDDYQMLLMASDKDTLAQKIEIMKESGLFDGCAEKELTYISYFFKMKKFHRHDVVVSEKDVADEPRLVLIGEGGADVVLHVSSDSFVIDKRERKEMDDHYKSDKGTNPLQEQRLGANYHGKITSRHITLCNLGKGNHFGSEYFFENEMEFR